MEFVDSPVLSTLAYNIDKADWPEFYGVLLKDFFFFLISSFLYAAKGYDNYEQIIMGQVGHIAM